MTLVKVEFKSGIIKDDTPLAAEGGWIDADKVRFRQGKPETIGGWEVASPTSFQGIARGAHAWPDLLAQRQVAFGTAAKLYAYTGGGIVDITPDYSSGVLTNPFATTAGLTTVVVTLAEHGLVQGMTVSFANADAVGGVTVNGSYTVAEVLTRNTFTVTHGSPATSTATGGGNAVEYTIAWPEGLVDGAGGLGYGTGAYGAGPYGLPNTTDFLPATWTFDNLGEILIANRRGLPLYLWQPQISYPEIVLNGDFAADANWAKGSGWAIGSGVASKSAGSASSLAQNVQGVAKSGYVYRLTATITRTAGSVKFRVNSGDPAAVIDVGEASNAITKSMTISRLFVMPSRAVDIVWEADASFAGSIDNVSIKLESKAILIKEAPRKVESVFVAPEGVVVAVGTFEVDGDYNPNCVRCSDIGNIRQWVPDSDNLASELILRGPGRLVRGLATREQNLVWSDEGLFRLRWQGEPGAAFEADLLGGGCGLIGPLAAIEHNGIAFWWSNNGNLYIFQGAIPQVVDCRVRRDVNDNLAPVQGEKIVAGINAEFSEVWWFYPDRRDGNECSRYVAFNWIEQHSTVGTFGRSSWLRAGLYGHPLAFGTDGYIYYHELGRTANGGLLISRLLSSAFDIEDGNNLFTVTEIALDVDDQSGPIDVTLKTRAYARAAEFSGVTQTYLETDTDPLRVRRLGRQAQTEYSASAAPSFWRLGATRLKVVKTGARR